MTSISSTVSFEVKGNSEGPLVLQIPSDAGAPAVLSASAPPLGYRVYTRTPACLLMVSDAEQTEGHFFLAAAMMASSTPALEASSEQLWNTVSHVT